VRREDRSLCYAAGDRRVSFDVLGNAPGEPQALLLGNFHIA
jgi:hypothetical protein